MCQLDCSRNHSSFNSTFNENFSSSGRIILTFFYSIILVVSLIGNLTVLFVIARSKKMRTATNIILANVASSDLLISVFSIPREMVEVFFGSRRWLIGGEAGLILCKLLYYVQDVSVAVSIQSLVVIAIDRYRGIVFPFRAPLSQRVCKILIPAVWFVAMCIHSPYLFGFRLNIEDDKFYCRFSWAPKFDERRTQEVYTIFISIFLIFLPLLIIVTLYSLIICDLKKQRKLNENGILNLRRQRQKEDAAILRGILTVILLFILCVTPLIVTALTFYFAWNWQIPDGMEKLFTASKFVLYSNASLNPCVYFTLSKSYRRGLKDVISFLTNSNNFKRKSFVKVEMNKR